MTTKKEKPSRKRFLNVIISNRKENNNEKEKTKENKIKLV